MAALNFDATSVAPAAPRSSEPLPVGLYTVEITSSDVRELKSGNGLGLEVEFTVIDPEQYAGRKVWQNFNIKHTNPTAEDIGTRELAALCRALGIFKLNDSDELFGKILRIKTKIRPAKGDYPAKTEAADFISATVPTPQAPQAAAPIPAPAAAGAKPWQRKAA